MDYKVIIPEINYRAIKFRQNDLIGIGVLNSSLILFEPKEVFSWHLSIMIKFTRLIDNGMPSYEDRTLAEEWEDEVDPLIIGEKLKPNSLFAARLTWNCTREIIYRVYDPSIVNNILLNI